MTAFNGISLTRLLFRKNRNLLLKRLVTRGLKTFTTTAVSKSTRTTILIFGRKVRRRLITLTSSIRSKASTSQAAQFATAGLFYYLGQLLRVLSESDKYKENNLPDIFVGGNGARIFNWLTGRTKLENNPRLEVLKEMLEDASGLPLKGKFRLKFSSYPKVEVASGMITDRNSLNNQFFDEEKFKDFVKEFNAIANQGGYDAKKARDEFVQKYRVRAFNCTNFEARMNDPIPPPEFGEAANGEYWAIPFSDNSFFVFPNVKSYSDNHHTARAMGEVFKSNFVPGGTYSKIIVERPAVFECAGNIWNLKRQGNLRLG